MTIQIDVNQIRFFLVNISDLTKLNYIELLLVQDKIDRYSKFDAEKDKIDGKAVLLNSTVKPEGFTNFDNAEQRQREQLYATCQVLSERLSVRTYYSNDLKKFYKFHFNPKRR